MSQSTSRSTGFLPAFDGGGDVSFVDADGYVTLDSDDHYFEVGGDSSADLVSIQITTDNVIAGTFTVETCLWPRDPINGPATKTAFNETSGIWIKNDPTGAYVASSGTGWTWTLLTGVKTAGVGGAVIDIGNLGAKRLRLKLVCTTGGKVSVIANAKS
jgi:hypothetical protein